MKTWALILCAIIASVLYWAGRPFHECVLVTFGAYALGTVIGKILYD